MTITPLTRLTILVLNTLATVTFVFLDMPWLVGLMMFGLSMDYLEFRRSWWPPMESAEEKKTPYQRYSAWTIGQVILAGMVNGTVWQKLLAPGSSALIYSAGIIMIGLTLYKMPYRAAVSMPADDAVAPTAPSYSFVDRARQFATGVTLGASQQNFFATHFPGNILHYYYALIVVAAILLIGDILSSRRR